MKKQIVTPNIRIVRFGAADIIVTSPGYEPQNEFGDERQVTAPARTSIFD